MAIQTVNTKLLAVCFHTHTHTHNPKGNVMRITVNNRELATILAALCYWKRKVIGGPTKLQCFREYDLASEGGHLQPLCDEEINDLFRRVNAVE
jgi:hypothetical protein